MNIQEPTKELEDDWDRWVAERPPAVRMVAEKFKPWKLYRLKSSGHRVTIVSFGEHQDGATLTVAVTGDFNFVINDRTVFGIKPDDMEECDLPGPDEKLGSILSGEQVEENLDALRLMVRPDLWMRMPDGSAVRRDQN
jgi:hypothetical protein